MKLALFSDTHFGFMEGEERENDCYDNAADAIEIALREKADAIVLAGDIFDKSVPTTLTVVRAMRVFAKTRNHAQSPLGISVEGKTGPRKALFQGVPVIAIHGTHELRPRDHANILALMQEAGYFVYVHAEHALLEKDGEKVAVHGLGGVPEKLARDALKAFNPRSLPGMRNLLVIHQSINEFLPTDDPMASTIALADLPGGFDLIANGHLHWTGQTELAQGGKLLLLGSTVTTQMKKLEAEKPKGVHLWDTRTNALSFHALPRCRKLFYHKIAFQETRPEDILAQCRAAVEVDLSTHRGSLAPMIRLKLMGSLARGVSNGDVSLAELEDAYRGKAILSLQKNLVSTDFTKKIAELRELQKSQKSVARLGLDILEKNLSETSFNNAFDAREVFELLADNKVDEVVELLSNAKPKKETVSEQTKPANEQNTLADYA